MNKDASAAGEKASGGLGNLRRIQARKKFADPLPRPTLAANARFVNGRNESSVLFLPPIAWRSLD
jgi:hypothetical protein